MADAATDTIHVPHKKGGKALILSLCMALVGTIGGFALIYFDVIPSGLLGAKSDSGASAEIVDVSEFAYVTVPPITLTLTGADAFQHLRVSAEIETTPEAKSAVAASLPRILDVCNGYLRALESEELTAPHALAVIRLQLLRRVQTIAGAGAVNDILITEFLLN